MRMTVDIDKKLLEDVIAPTGEKSKSKAVNKAMEEFIQRQRIRELRGMLGKTDLVDNWRELEELEIKEIEESYGPAKPLEGAPISKRRGRRVERK